MNDAAETVNEIGATIRRVMGGTSGILYVSLNSVSCQIFMIELFLFDLLF